VPFKTIQKALDLAAPGSTITLAAGEYRESIVTKTAGTAAEPDHHQGPGEPARA
jgi:pectin methylesterase-like acyl-CoA thioesterase